MSTFLHDLKFGARLLAKTPAFTAVAALSLALGIGANTTIFTLVNAVLLNPLPVEDPSQLVSVWTTDERNKSNQAAFGFLQTSPMNFRDLRDKNEVFSGITGHVGVPLNITGRHRPAEQVFGELVTGQFLLGARRAAAGRARLPADEGPDARARSWLRCSVWRVAEAVLAATPRSWDARSTSTATPSRSSA
jgi:hypothetical protein